MYVYALFVSCAVFIYYFNYLSFAIWLSGRKVAIKLIDWLIDWLIDNCFNHGIDQAIWHSRVNVVCIYTVSQKRVPL